MLLTAWHFRRRKVLYKVIRELEAMKIQSVYRSRIETLLYLNSLTDIEAGVPLEFKRFNIFLYIY